MAPRLIELCFQTAGIWEMGTRGRMGLPQQIARVSALRDSVTADGRLYARVRERPGGDGFDAEVVDAAGNVYVVLEGYRTVELPVAIDGVQLKPLEQAVA